MPFHPPLRSPAGLRQSLGSDALQDLRRDLRAQARGSRKDERNCDPSWRNWHEYVCGGSLKWGIPKTIGFNPRILECSISFWMIWHFRKWVIWVIMRDVPSYVFLVEYWAQKLGYCAHIWNLVHIIDATMEQTWGFYPEIIDLSNKVMGVYTNHYMIKYKWNGIWWDVSKSGFVQTWEFPKTTSLIVNTIENKSNLAYTTPCSEKTRLVNSLNFGLWHVLVSMVG